MNQKQIADMGIFNFLNWVVAVLACLLLTSNFASPLSADDDAPKKELTIKDIMVKAHKPAKDCLLYTSPSPRDATLSRMPSSA